MKNCIVRDKFIRKEFFKKEPLRIALNFLSLDVRLSISFRYSAGILLRNLNSNSNITKANNRCVQTGRRKSLLRNFRLSRISFRNKALFGQVLGVVKKSW